MCPSASAYSWALAQEERVSQERVESARTADGNAADTLADGAAATVEAPFSAEGAAIGRWISMSGQFNERLLTTVYWTLGGLATVFVALIGFNWFTTFRLYEHDKSALREELLGILKAAIAEDLSKTESELTRPNAEIKTQIKESFNEESKKYFAQIKNVNDRIKHLSTMSNYFQRQMEAELWRMKGVHANAISYELEAAEFAKNYEDLRAEFSFCLDNIKKDLKHLSSVDLMTSSSLARVLEGVPIELKIIKNEIENILSSKQST